MSLFTWSENINEKGLICLVHSQKMTTEIGGIYFDQSSLHHQKDLYYKHKER